MSTNQPERASQVGAVFSDAIAAHQRFFARGIESVVAAADACAHALKAGHKILAFGNGGSASDAQHLAAELVGRFEADRGGLAAIALTADSTITTAVANDYGYDHVFSRQVEALGARGDIAIGISTSGTSSNVATALASAQRKGLITIALTGRDGGRIGASADIHVNVPEASTARVQEVHRTILHAICALIDIA